jgi:hypothetical protein
MSEVNETLGMGTKGFFDPEGVVQCRAVARLQRANVIVILPRVSFALLIAP